MLPYVRHFRDAGHRCVVASSFPQKYDYFPTIGFRPSQKLKRLTRWRHWLASRWRRDDVVVIDREVFDAPDSFFEERFRRSARRLVLDIDDAVFLRYPEKFERLIPMADLVICGNSFIERWVREWNESTILIPTCVEIDEYAGKDWAAATGSRLRVGWIGTPANLEALHVAAPALRQLAKRHDFELLVVTSDAAPLQNVELQGVNVRFEAWNADTDLEQLRQFDIGIMPLRADVEWNQFKCGFKLIQYMATAIPAIASPVGVNAEIVSHGVDGYLASSDDDWTQILEQLIGNPDLRRKVGTAGRETVRQRFSVAAHFPGYEQALKDLVAGHLLTGD